MGNGKDPLGILTPTPAPQKQNADPLGILKKKASGEDLSNGGTNGSFAGLLGGSVKSANIGSAAIKKLPIEDISEYNKRFEDITGHKEINLGSDLPQIAKAREEKKYLTYRDIEEYQIKPVLNDVASGVVQSEDLKKLYQQPYGKKIVSEVINQNLPEIGTMGLDEDVFGNEKKWETIAQSIQSKNRQQGVDAQNQQEFELDNELANSLKDYTYGQDHIAVRGGGEAVNERQQNAFGIVNTTNPSELSAALRNINNSSKVWDSEGNEVDKKLLAKKIGTRLFQVKAQENIHPEITQLSDKVKLAVSKVPVEWKKQGMTDELLNRDAEYVIDGLNYIRDSDPGRYAMIMGTIDKLDKIAETDYQELVGLGKEINSFRKFKQGEYVEKDNRNFLTPQGKKALLGGWLYEELKRTGKNKQTFRIPQKDIIEAYKNVPADLKDDDLLRDIIKDEVGPAFGFLPIAKGEGIPKRGLGRQILTNTADPFAGILKTADYSFDSPFDAYLKSKELDRGDNIVLNSKGEYTNKSSDTFFNKAVGGLFSFLSQVGIARGIGAVTAKGTNALIGQVAPRAATVTTSEAALNVGTPLSVIAQQYGDEYVDFLEKTGNPTKAALGAFVSTVTQGAIERFVLPDVKIADQAALLFARKNLAKDIINVVENGGGKAGVLKTIKDFTANTLSTLSKEAIAEENLQNFANYLTEMVVSPKTAQNRDLMQETEDITKAAVVQMAIPAVLGGAGETKIKRGLNKVQLNHIGVNAEDYQKALDNQFAMGKMLQEDYDLASGIIQLHRDNIINAPKYDSKGELISAERQLEYAYQSTVQETLQKQAEKQRDKIQREPIEKKIEEADKIKRQIFYGEEAEGLPPKEGQPITIDQDRDLMDEEGQDLSKDELLATLKSKAGELEQGMDLQYFKDKAAEDPAKYIEKYGEETVMDLIKDIPTETLKGNLDLFLDISPNAPSVKILDKIIAEREAAEALSTVSGKEVATPTALRDVESAAKALEEPSLEQQLKDIKEGNTVTFEYKNESEVPEIFKDKISSKGEINGKPYVKVTMAKSLADFHLQEKPKSESLLSKEQTPPALSDVESEKKQIEDFGVAKEDVEATHGLLGRVFDGLKKAGLTAAKNVGDWVGIGKGEEKPYSLKINGKDVQVKNVQPEVVNGFYSPLEKIINESKSDKLPAKQWADKFAKGEEAKWTGLKDWLAKQQGSVSKADIQQYLKDNRISVVEVVKGDRSTTLTKNDFKISNNEVGVVAEGNGYTIEKSDNQNRSNPYDLYYDGEYIQENKSIDDAIDRAIRDSRNRKATPESGVKFQQYQLEGEKENYKEILVTMPKKEVTRDMSDAEIIRRTESNMEKNTFRSSHFDEPNILVHLRMNTRTDAQGNKVLFLEEVQSDWGQKGKKEGFNEPIDFKRVETDKYKGYTAEVKGKTLSIAEMPNGKFNTTIDGNYNGSFNTLQEAKNNLSTLRDTAIPQAPFVTDTNAWTKLGLKVALKEAVKQGADKIAWTTGEQQNERYDLSKSVSKIEINKKGNNYEVKAYDKGDQVQVTPIKEEIVSEKELEGVVGKEIANKAINEGQTSFEGSDLKVGGKGMKGFYGSPTEGSLGIVGNVAKSLFKQEPKTVDIDVSPEFVKDDLQVVYRPNEPMGRVWLVEDNQGRVRGRLSTKESAEQEKEGMLKQRQSARKVITQHSIDITPELKASVEGGQPLFKDAEAQYRIESGKNIVEAIKDFNGSPRATVALTHEIMHPTVVAIIDGAKEGNEVGAKHTATIVNEFNKANPNSKVTIEDLIKGNDAFKDGTTSKQYRAVQEFIAKSWEKYHREGGKGFSEAFQKVLDQITKAFQSVYKSLSGKQLTPELRKMFDDILGKSESLLSKEQTPPALRDVESTAKALEGKYKKDAHNLTNWTLDKSKRLKELQDKEDDNILSKNEEKEFEGLMTEFDLVDVDLLPKEHEKTLGFLFDVPHSKNTPKAIAEAYHKAKAEGTNPELVKAVESLLSKEQPTPQQPTVSGKEGDVEKTTKALKDKEGNDIKLYHGSAEPIKEFNEKMAGTTTRKMAINADRFEHGIEAIYLTNDKKEAEGYASRATGHKSKGHVQEVSVDLKNPLVIDDNYIKENLTGGSKVDDYENSSDVWDTEAVDIIDKEGGGESITRKYDGIIIRGDVKEKESITVLVFKGQKVKAIEQSIPTQEAKAEQPTVLGKEVGSGVGGEVKRTAKPISKRIAVEHAGHESAKRVTGANENTLEIDGYGTIPTSTFINTLVENGRLSKDALKNRHIQLTEEYATKLLNENSDLFPKENTETSKVETNIPTFENAKNEYDAVKEKYAKHLKKDGGLRANTPDNVKKEIEDAYTKMQSTVKQEREKRVSEDKRDTGLIDGIERIKDNASAFTLVKMAMNRGVIPERQFNDFGKNLLHIIADAKDSHEVTMQTAEIIQDFSKRANVKVDDTLARELQAAENLKYEPVEQSLPPQEVKAEQPTVLETKATEQKIAELEAERDAKILKEGKPDVKLEFVSAKELVDSKDPIGNRNIHNDIKERFKKLKEILDCIHG